jgi:RNA polymerase sigma-70 factor (ECF subfamily)
METISASVAERCDQSAPLLDERQFRQLVLDQHKRLFRFVLKYLSSHADAEDVTQQAFIEAWRSRQNFRGDASLSTWLFGIAMNLIRNHLSRSKSRRYQFVSDDLLENYESDAETPAEAAERRNRLAVLNRELAALDPGMRDVVILVGMEGVAYQDAADILGIPIGTVRSRLSRARMQLRQKLDGTSPELSSTHRTEV